MTNGIEAIYPLSPTQQGMLFHTIYAPESGVYVGQVSCRLRGEFSGPALEEAWQRLLERHSALRTSFVWRRVEEPRQVVHRDVRLAVQRLDWTKVPADEHQVRLEAYARADRQRGFGDYFGYTFVLRGQAEVMLEADVKPWDIAPFKVLFEEAGGRFTDFAGRPTIYSGTVVASNGRLHDEALRLLGG